MLLWTGAALKICMQAAKRGHVTQCLSFPLPKDSQGIPPLRNILYIRIQIPQSWRKVMRLTHIHFNEIFDIQIDIKYGIDRRRYWRYPCSESEIKPSRNDSILITSLMHWLLFIHKILFSSTCFEPQVLIFRRIQLYTCSIWYCHSLWEFLVSCRYTDWVRTDCRGKVVGGLNSVTLPKTFSSSNKILEQKHKTVYNHVQAAYGLPNLSWILTKKSALWNWPCEQLIITQFVLLKTSTKNWH